MAGMTDLMVGTASREKKRVASLKICGIQRHEYVLTAMLKTYHQNIVKLSNKIPLIPVNLVVP
jgi:hypothetical protein